jgi:pimeloyl-ACP methyl ester carboxylesterase
LAALEQTGVIRKNPRHPFRYRPAGTLFTNWFRSNVWTNIQVTQQPFSKWVITLHGIRTRGTWQKQLNESLNRAGLSHAPFDYGFFSVLKLMFPPARERVLARFLKEYTDHIARNGKRPSIIGHSFGAYLICKAMEKYSDIQFDQIILCGSIVDSTFNWGAKIPSQASRVLNDFGSRDLWVRVAGWVIVDAGESGTKGFENTANGAVIQRSHRGFRHSDYFYRLNYENNWIPFLRGLNPNQNAGQIHTKTNKRFVVTLVVLSLATLFLITLFLRRC